VSRLNLARRTSLVVALSLTALISAAVFTSQSAHAQSSSCITYYTSSSAVPTGYGAAFNLFSAGHEPLVSIDCSGSAPKLTVGSNQSNQYVYKSGYVYANGWQPINLTGTLVSGSSAWYSTQGTVSLPAPSSNWTYAVGYVCQWNGTAWLCGCHDTQCSTGMWQLQTYEVPQQASGGGSGAGTRNYLVGIYMGGSADNPAFHSFVGYYPDFTIGNSYSGPDGSGSNPCTENSGYPVVVANSHFYPGTSASDPNAAANGSYNGIYANLMQNFYAPCAASIYAIRINWEWPGNWFQFSPYYSGGYSNPSISPAVWIAGWQNFVKALRANPATAHIKVAWDYPVLSQGANALAYYPGDAYVDIIGTDYYFNTQYDGPTSADSWNKAMGSGGLNDMAAFAAAHNKPIGFWEVSDDYDDGYATTQFGNWINSHNVVAVTWWDDDGSGGRKIQHTQAAQNAFVQAFGNRTYAGTYWPTGLMPLPSSKPSGF
jgi:Glycosyl hydrolase family 26